VCLKSVNWPTLTHSHSQHTLTHLHAHMHTHTFHTLKEWICVDCYSTQFWRLLGELELNSSNLTQFNLELNLLIGIQSTNSIPNSTLFELRRINAIRHRTTLNCSELWLMHVSDAPNTIWIHLNFFSIHSKIKKFRT